MWAENVKLAHDALEEHAQPITQVLPVTEQVDFTKKSGGGIIGRSFTGMGRVQGKPSLNVTVASCPFPCCRACQPNWMDAPPECSSKVIASVS